MKVHTIEFAAAIEQELKKYLDEWGGGFPMRFTRFVDLGGKQTDLHVYSGKEGTSPWMVARIKSIMKGEDGECIQVFVTISGGQKKMEEVVVSPEVWKLPALADKVLQFSKNDMLTKISEGGAALEGGASGALEGGDAGTSSRSEDEDVDELEDLDTSGILASDDAGDSDFDPSDMIAQANAEGDDDDKVEDPSDLINKLNEEEGESEKE